LKSSKTDQPFRQSCFKYVVFPHPGRPATSKTLGDTSPSPSLATPPASSTHTTNSKPQSGSTG
jgi:hypothetical protein